jgi:hypothetical protein
LRPEAPQFILVKSAVPPFANLTFQLAFDQAGENFHTATPMFGAEVALVPERDPNKEALEQVGFLHLPECNANTGIPNYRLKTVRFGKGQDPLSTQQRSINFSRPHPFEFSFKNRAGFCYVEPFLNMLSKGFQD